MYRTVNKPQLREIDGVKPILLGFMDNDENTHANIAIDSGLGLLKKAAVLFLRTVCVPVVAIWGDRPLPRA